MSSLRRVFRPLSSQMVLMTAFLGSVLKKSWIGSTKSLKPRAVAGRHQRLSQRSQDGEYRLSFSAGGYNPEGAAS